MPSNAFTRPELAWLEASGRPIDGLCRPRFGRCVQLQQLLPKIVNAVIGRLVHVDMIGLIKAEQHRLRIPANVLKGSIDRPQAAHQPVIVELGVAEEGINIDRVERGGSSAFQLIAPQLEKDMRCSKIAFDPIENAKGFLGCARGQRRALCRRDGDGYNRRKRHQLALNPSYKPAANLDWRGPQILRRECKTSHDFLLGGSDRKFAIARAKEP
ncbi:MAG TPA: hypothetical protein VMU69_28780 [Bradyrhizobium sp.]|nr:hypothetical protein [Bradyrhizobium sp.]